MKESEDIINDVIDGRPQPFISVRSIACEDNEFSEYIPFAENAEKLLYNSKLIDGVKIKIGNFRWKLNKRHNF